MKISKSFYVLFTILVVSLYFSCSKEENETNVFDSPNILLIIADDLGKDAINGYTEGNIKPSTPNIDAIRNKGLMFKNFWVNPLCSPSRSSIITGKYGFRTGVKGVGDVLKTSEVSLQKYISNNTNNKYASALIGKWHLSGNNTSVNPESFGIDYYKGVIRGAVDDYYKWQMTEDGVSSFQTKYATEAFTDLAIDWVNNQSKPWFLWLAYNAPHTPFHTPPSNMHKQGSLPDYTNGLNPTPYFMAAIEAMDYQIGRLLDNIPKSERENTIIIFIGDNGTPSQVAQSPFTSSTVKNTLYQGGINVPMFISGTSVSRTGTDNNLITGTDLFATIAEIAGISISEINDSKSFKSLFNHSSTIREYQYSELVDGNINNWTIRNNRFKLMVSADGNKEMFNLENDPYEQKNLLLGNLTSEEASAKSALENELLNIRK